MNCPVIGCDGELHEIEEIYRMRRYQCDKCMVPWNEVELGKIRGSEQTAKGAKE